MGVLKKDLSYYLSLRYHIVIEKDFDYDGKGYYVAEIPDLRGCGAEGETIEEFDFEFDFKNGNFIKAE